MTKKNAMTRVGLVTAKQMNCTIIFALNRKILAKSFEGTTAVKKRKAP